MPPTYCRHYQRRMRHGKRGNNTRSVCRCSGIYRSGIICHKKLLSSAHGSVRHKETDSTETKNNIAGSRTGITSSGVPLPFRTVFNYSGTSLTALCCTKYCPDLSSEYCPFCFLEFHGLKFPAFHQTYKRFSVLPKRRSTDTGTYH